MPLSLNRSSYAITVKTSSKIYTNLGMVGMITILETDSTKGIGWTCLCVLLDRPFLFLLSRLTGKPTIVCPRMVSNQSSTATSQIKQMNTL